MKYATAFLVIAVTSLLTSCADLAPAPKGSIQHIVLAWLKKPGDAADRARVIAAAKQLKADIREVKTLAVGQVLPSDRPIVDDSFDVALVMRFNTKAELDAYEKSPVHQKAVKEVLLPLTSKVVVHDFVNE